MNTLKVYPKKFREAYEKLIKISGVKQDPKTYHNKIFFISFIMAICFSTGFYFLKINTAYGFLTFVLMMIFFYFRISLKANSRIKDMEKIFPDLISLMASNLKSGITIDRAFLFSARPEFKPLDEIILKAGKEIATGKDILHVLNKMKEEIGSEKISKVLSLIISGMKAGGNIADLLEETSKNIKEKDIIEKKAASSILMYLIFIFFAIGIGAPILFGLSTVLVQIVIQLTSRMPDIGAQQANIPFSFSQVSISLKFITYFAILFLIATDFISSFVIGLVNKGNAKSGLKYFIPLLILSLTLFFIVKTVLSGILLKTISMT